jgi:predicted porin
MMKKTLIALAATAATGAFAQVTLSGNLDQTVYAQGTASMWASNANSTSLWKMSGVEDLGSGLKASFNLIAEINMQKGSLGSGSTGAATATATTSNAQPSLFNRGANVAIESSMGTLMIGRQNDAWWESAGAFSTSQSNSFGSNNLTAIQSGATDTTFKATAASASGYGLTKFAANVANDGNTGTSPFVFATGVGYTTPTVAGFTGKVVQSTANYNDGGDSTGASYSLNYTNGPLKAMYASSSKNATDGATAWTQTAAAASYNIGATTLTIINNKSAFKGLAQALDDSTVTAVGLNYVVNPQLDISASYAILTNDETTTYKATHTGITARYAFSKRTSVYAGIGNVNNEGGASTTVIYGGSGQATGANTSATMLGLRHQF